MRKLLRVVVILSIFAITAGVCWHEFGSGGRRHQGRTENEWIASLATPPAEKEMQEWRALDAEAVPILARALGRGTSPPWKWYETNWYKFPAALKKRLPKPRDPVNIRRNAPLVLAGLNCDIGEAAPALGRALRDEDENVRYNAAICLKGLLPKLGDGKAHILPDLLHAMQDTDHFVRENVTQCLGNYAGQSHAVGPVLLQGFNDPIPFNRYLAVQSLKRMNLEEAGRGDAELMLIRGLNHNDLMVCADAALALSQTKWDPSREVPEITKMLTSDQPAKQHVAAVALGKYGPQAASALPALQHAFETGEPRVRVAASNALVKIDPRTAAGESAGTNEPVSVAKP